ncbi:MAG: hypothetical protein MSA13_03295 [Prevotella sp.]|nr:hypothetical protein [Prevotella sp.]
MTSTKQNPSAHHGTPSKKHHSPWQQTRGANTVKKKKHRNQVLITPQSGANHTANST